MIEIHVHVGCTFSMCDDPWNGCILNSKLNFDETWHLIFICTYYAKCRQLTHALIIQTISLQIFTLWYIQFTNSDNVKHMYNEMVWPRLQKQEGFLRKDSNLPFTVVIIKVAVNLTRQTRLPRQIHMFKSIMYASFLSNDASFLLIWEFFPKKM